MQAGPSTLGRMQATVAYFLMADNRRRMPSSAYLRAELTEAHQAHQSYPPGAALLCCSPCCTALARGPSLCVTGFLWKQQLKGKSIEASVMLLSGGPACACLC